MLILLPALTFIGAIGWCMYAISKRKPTWQKATNRRPAEKENVTLVPIVFEEQQEIINA